MAEPAFVGRRSIVGALQATGGVFRTAAAASGPLGVPSGSEVVTGRAGCLNWARPDLWGGRRVSAAPTRRNLCRVLPRGSRAGRCCQTPAPGVRAWPEGANQPRRAGAEVLESGALARAVA